MPQSSKDVEELPFMRVLIMGPPKAGKTSLIATCEDPYVIASDDKYALRPAVRLARKEFAWDAAYGTDAQTIEKCLHEARGGVKEKRYRTVFWDTITMYTSRIKRVYEDATRNAAGESDGRRFYPKLADHVEGILERLFTLNAHIVVTAHYDDAPGAEIEGQVKKMGEGVVPGLPGKLRTKVPALFQDVVFLEKRAGKRQFLTASGGVWGAGCRSLPGVESCDANVMTLWKLMKGGGRKEK